MTSNVLGVAAGGEAHASTDVRQDGAAHLRSGSDAMKKGNAPDQQLHHELGDAALLRAADDSRIVWAQVKGYPFWPVCSSTPKMQVSSVRAHAFRPCCAYLPLSSRATPASSSHHNAASMCIAPALLACLFCWCASAGMPRSRCGAVHRQLLHPSILDAECAGP
jgi:hypothetical protein